MIQITDDKLEKLEQLDRIEYRQRKEEIDRNHNQTPYWIVYWFMILICLTVILNPGIFVLTYGWKVAVIINVCVFVYTICVMILCVVGSAIKAKKNSEKLKELDEEYFKTIAR